MKHTTKSRVLSLLLVLAMVFSMLPTSVFAAETTATWSKVDAADITAVDTIAITMTNPSGVTYVLPSNETQKNSAPVVTVSEDGQTLTTGDSTSYGWTVTAVKDGYTISKGSAYLYTDNSNNGVMVGETMAVWAVDGTYLSATDLGGNTRWLGVYDNNGGDYAAVASPNWRAYKNTTGNTKGQTLSFWKLNAEDSGSTDNTEPVELPSYQLTTSIADGDTVLLYNAGNSVALSSAASGYKLAGVIAEVDGGTISTNESALLWTVGVTEDGTYTFTQGDLVLGMVQSGTYINMSTNASDGFTDWTLEVSSTEGVFYLKNTNMPPSSFGAYYLEYYNGFTAYASSTPSDSAYGIQFYKAAEENEEEPTAPSAPTDPSEPDVPEVSYAEKMTALPNNDDIILIYNPANTAAMGSAPSGKKMAGVTAEAAEGKLPIAEDMAQLRVAIDESGNYIFTADGKYLTSADTGNGLSLAEELTDCGKWTFEAAADGTWYIRNVGANYNGNYNQAMEYYSGFTTYGIKETAIYQMELYLVEAAPVYPVPDGTYVIWAPAYNMALSSKYTGYYNSGTDVTEGEAGLEGYTAADVWTVTNNGDDTISIAFGGENLAMADSRSSMPLGEVNDKWVLEDAGNGLFYVKNTVRGAYIEWYASKNNWSGYNYINSGSEGMFALRFTPAQAVDEPLSSLPEAGDEVMIYNVAAEGVLGAQNDIQSIENVLATVSEGAVTAENGGVIFHVEISGGYYRFHNETYGYLCSTGTGNNAFYSTEASEDADWTLEELGDGFRMLSRTAKYNGTSAQYLEYYADSYKTYSFYATNKDGSAADTTIYEFHFYPCANEAVTEWIVNQPDVIFGTVYPAYVGTDYTYTFSMDTVFGVKELKVTNSTLDKEYAYTLEGETYSVTIPAADIDAIVEKQTAEGIPTPILALNISGTDNKDVEFANGSAIDIKDEPGIGEVTPAPGTETGEDKAPVISAEITNAGEAPNITMTVNGVEVEAVCENGTVSYTPAEDLAEGRTTVILTVKRGDSKEVSKTWSFIVGKAQYQLYFGQLHSHTTYSDGSGSLEAALEYVASLPKSANVDFVAFTDHSNYFDASGAANPEGALYDMSLATSESQKLWTAYKQTIADFNASQSDIIAIGGFEMTWSGGPGHINTFNTPGIVSRNNTALNSKTADAGLKAYYSLLSQAGGIDSVNQFNHPGSTFGTFSDFAYWDPVIDERIQLVEVGNGEGQIGAGGYFPSYEYYTMALDKGWHVAPTNNQDNHKGKWGNANEARDVILTDDFSEAGIYSAIRAMRLYATEDKNLEIGYSVNGQLLGSAITEVPEQLNFAVTVYDPDKSDSISKVELIVNSGKVAYTWDDPADLADGALEVTLDPTYSYYYVRVTEGDGDLAVTAPVWVGESLKLGISSVQTATSTPVTDEELTISTTLFNSEGAEATVKSLTYTTAGDLVLGCDTTGYTIPNSGTLTVDFDYTPTTAKLTTVTVTAVVELEETEYEFTMDIELDVQDASKLVYIGIDASHYNEYVNGNYKDSMGNFGALAAEFGVRTVTLFESKDLIDACHNEKYKALILTAPSRRSAEAQASDPLKVYTEEELAAINEFNREGGTVILAGWSDHYENYPDVESIANMEAQEHMAATQNAVLEMLGSSLRIGDDATYDDDHNGGQAYRLYFNTYGDSFLTEGVEVDPDHPHDRLYTEVFSHYGGASVYTADGNLPETVTPIVFGHSGTYSVDVDTDGLGGDNMPKYEYAEGDSRLMIMATERIGEQGLIIVSGAAFMSNFEVQATIEDSGSEKNYSNYRICENLLAYINPITVTPIAEVHAQSEVGYKYTIEGTVTSNASGYDKDTAFFDCVYVQDETGGICCFPVAGNYKVGDKVRITGTTEFYQGEPELQVTSIEVIGEGEAVQPTAVTAAQINDRSAEGKLITLSGKVTSFELANGLVQTIMVVDEAGDTARVFIDGYITTAEDVKALEVGCGITVTGLASYDDTFNAPDGPFPRIRIRDRADVVCTEHIHDFAGTEVQPTCVAEGYSEYLCQCGYSYRDSFVPAKGHATASVVTAPTHNAMGYTVTACENCDYSFVHAFTDALEHAFTKEVTKQATCTAEGEWTFKCECGVSYTQIIPVTGHSCVKTVVAPECEKYGYTVYQCSGCDYSYLADPTEPTGHSYTGKYVGGGLMQYTCSCGHTYTDLHNCPSAAYTDLDPEKWYHDATDFVLSQGIMIGTGEDTFAPSCQLTRGQIVTILYRLAGEPAVTEAAPFTDVKETAYYAKAVAWGYATGIIKGVTDTAFAPGQVVTRQQMATFLYRYAGSPAVTADAVKDFADRADISGYARDAMNWIVSAGIITGTTATTLSPKDATTRVQAAAIVYRYLIAA